MWWDKNVKMSQRKHERGYNIEAVLQDDNSYLKHCISTLHFLHPLRNSCVLQRLLNDQRLYAFPFGMYPQEHIDIFLDHIRDETFKETSDEEKANVSLRQVGGLCSLMAPLQLFYHLPQLNVQNAEFSNFMRICTLDPQSGEYTAPLPRDLPGTYDRFQSARQKIASSRVKDKRGYANGYVDSMLQALLECLQLNHPITEMEPHIRTRRVTCLEHLPNCPEENYPVLTWIPPKWKSLHSVFADLDARNNFLGGCFNLVQGDGNVANVAHFVAFLKPNHWKIFDAESLQPWALNKCKFLNEYEGWWVREVILLYDKSGYKKEIDTSRENEELTQSFHNLVLSET